MIQYARFDDGASLGSVASALLVAMPSNDWWTGGDWVPAGSVSAASWALGASVGVQETTTDSTWSNAYLFPLPTVAPPTGTNNYRVILYGTNPPVVGQAVGSFDCPVCLPNVQVPSGKVGI